MSSFLHGSVSRTSSRVLIIGPTPMLTRRRTSENASDPHHLTARDLNKHGRQHRRTGNEQDRTAPTKCPRGLPLLLPTSLPVLVVRK